LDEAKAEREAAFARLNAVAMLSVPATSIGSGLLDIPTAPAALTDQDTIAIRVAKAEATASERRITAEQINSRPDVTASVGVTRYGQEDQTALTFGLSLPLPLFDRNRGNIDAAR